MCLARLHQAKALIVGNRLLRALRQADLRWSGEFVLQGLSELGGRRFSIVDVVAASRHLHQLAEQPHGRVA
ncbi:MAG: hypothetical protein EOO63_01715 [Hymenobacter sp.]|nr:MAG: hypothetical protein EOO63_01715 [Hymenobacter sp.]